jgi:hypothetical protein
MAARAKVQEENATLVEYARKTLEGGEQEKKKLIGQLELKETFEFKFRESQL